MNKYPLISVIVTTYDRYELLEKTIYSFLKHCTYKNLELILCDDGSPKIIQEKLKQLPFDKFFFSNTNKGFCHNINKGHNFASGEYIFYLQDDWLFVGQNDFLEKGIDLLSENPKIGIVKYRCNLKDFNKYERCTTISGKHYILISKNQKKWRSRLYIYSDNPHLKRKSFSKYIGNYIGGLSFSEFIYSAKVNAQSKYKTAAFLDNYFEHIGNEKSFNSISKKQRWKRFLLKLFHRNYIFILLHIIFSFSYIAKKYSKIFYRNNLNF